MDKSETVKPKRKFNWKKGQGCWCASCQQKQRAFCHLSIRWCLRDARSRSILFERAITWGRRPESTAPCASTEPVQESSLIDQIWGWYWIEIRVRQAFKLYAIKIILLLCNTSGQWEGHDPSAWYRDGSGPTGVPQRRVRWMEAKWSGKTELS